MCAAIRWWSSFLQKVKHVPHYFGRACDMPTSERAFTPRSYSGSEDPFGLERELDRRRCFGVFVKLSHRNRGF
jgi:hypothetical protein